MCLSMSIWGISWSSAKVLSRYGEAANIAHIRFVIVLIVLGVILKIAKIPFGFSKANWIPMIGASLSTVTYSVLFFYALKSGVCQQKEVMRATRYFVSSLVFSLFGTTTTNNNRECTHDDEFTQRCERRSSYLCRTHVHHTRTTQLFFESCSVEKSVFTRNNRKRKF